MRSLSAAIIFFLLQTRTAESFSATNNRRQISPFASFTRRTFRLHSSPSPASSGGPSGEGESSDYSNEETLLCIDFAVNPGTDLDEAVAKVSKFCQSFPFAAVLPVQPLHYLPVYEDGGVEVKFLRKKTDVKSGNDGGIRFFIEKVVGDDDASDDETEVDEEGERPVIEVTAKRNSKGQVISKLMSEKLIVTNFVAAISGEEQSRFGQPPTDVVQVKSMYHKWL